MPIAYYQLAPGNAGQPGYAVAKQLAFQCAAMFGPVRFTGAGVGPNSCCAAVATNPNPGAGFPASNPVTGFQLNAQPTFGAPALPYAVAFGNSQLAVGGLAVAVGGHAERVALNAVAAVGGVGALYPPVANSAVLFVELTPCLNCQNWLAGVADGGAANPFNGIINGAGATTLHVWWRWEYPAPGVLPLGMGGLAALGGIPAMRDFHDAPPGVRLAWQWNDINANW
ncbi:MAG: hypothetical protein HY735_25880 [Verrucomicrobia bacterium]|nr:hypothetical protein [Verrucomicrobiota bacterium]